MLSERIIRIIEDIFIILFVLAIPLVYTTSTPDNQVAIKFVFLSISLFLFSFLLLLKFPKNHRVRITRSAFIILILLISYTFLTAIGLFYTTNLSDGIFSFSKIILFLSFILLVFINTDDPLLFIQKISRAFVVLGLVIILTGIYQLTRLYFNGIINHENLYQITVTFGHKNIYAQILLLSLPFSIYVLNAKQSFWRYMAVFNVCFILVLLTVLMTRSVWVSAILSFVFTTSVGLITLKPKLLKLKKLGLILISVILIISTSVFLYSKLDHSSAFQKQISKIFNFNYGSTKDRIVLWEKSLQLAREKPLFGHGPGSWKVEILKYGNQNLKSKDNLTFYQRPHNDYLWILCEQGLIALSLYLGFFLAIIYMAIKLLNKNLTKEIKRFVLAMIFALGCYLSFSFFSFPMDRIEFIVFLSLIIGSLLVLSNKFKTDQNKIRSIQLNYLTFGILLILILTTWVGINRLNSEIHLKKAYEARTKNNWKTLISEIDLANNWFYNIDPFSTPLDWYKGLANFNAGKYKEASHDFNEAYKINPYHIHVLNNLATCKGIEGDYQTALELYNKALDIAPNFEDAIYNSCAVYQKQNDMDKAIECLKKVHDPQNTDRYTQIMLILMKQKLNELLNSNQETKVKIYIQSVLQNHNKLINLFKESVQNKNSIEQQVLRSAS